MVEKHIVFTLDTLTYTDENGVDHYTEGQPVYCGETHENGIEYCEEHQPAPSASLESDR